MAVDVVAEEGRAVLGHLAEASVWKESGLDESLESVADAEDKAATVDKSVDGISYLLVVENVGDELTASVRLVTG